MKITNLSFCCSFMPIMHIVLETGCVLQEVALFDGKTKQCTALSAYLVSLSEMSIQ